MSWGHIFCSTRREPLRTLPCSKLSCLWLSDQVQGEDNLYHGQQGRDAQYLIQRGRREICIMPTLSLNRNHCQPYTRVVRNSLMLLQGIWSGYRRYLRLTSRDELCSM